MSNEVEERKELIAYVPNLLSTGRFLLSLTLLQVRPFSAPFVMLYLTCGMTDALDGYLARKHHVESELGAKLDSVADLVFFLVVLRVLVSVIAIPFVMLAWALVLIVARGAGLATSYKRFGEYAALHTYAYKVTAFCFFVFPLAQLFLGVVLSGGALLGIATYATVEEIYINAKSQTLNLDIKSVKYLNQPR